MRRKTKAIVYEGKIIEKYKHLKTKWIQLAIIGTGIPFVISSFVALCNNPSDFLTLFNNGDIILSLFSLSLTLVFDLFQIKEKDDEKLSKAFVLSLVLICCQLTCYCLIKIKLATITDKISIKHTITSILMSLFIIVFSFASCAFSIEAMFNHKGGDNNDNNEHN